MRPSFPELMYGLFWLVMAVVLILFAIRAFSMMDLLEKRMQQSTVHHDALMRMADKALDDHARFLREHVKLERLPAR